MVTLPDCIDHVIGCRILTLDLDGEYKKIGNRRKAMRYKGRAAEEASMGFARYVRSSKMAISRKKVISSKYANLEIYRILMLYNSPH